MSILNKLLTEKMRPQNFSQIILTNRVKKSIGSGDLNQNYLFSGIQGIGKTSIAKILAKGRSTLYLNASSERGIGTVREIITDFASTKSTIPSEKNDYKVIILDELDGATTEYYNSLRATMEKFSEHVRFIGTCNHINKIPEPIQSRFLLIKLEPQDSEEEEELIELYKKRILTVTSKLNIEWENDNVLNQFVKKNFPDLRKIFQQIQDFDTSKIKNITLKDIKRNSFTFSDIYKLIVETPNPHKNYKLIMTEYISKVDEVFFSLNSEFPDWLIENKPSLESKLPHILVTIPEWEYKKNFLIDGVSGLIACIMQLQQICQSK
jgi:DNA polymerase III delta prime subunit